MRTLSSIAATAVLASSVLTFAGDAKYTPLSVKTGQWKVTETSAATGDLPQSIQDRIAQMPPEQRAKTEAMVRSRLNGTPHAIAYDTCVTKEDLNRAPFSDSKEHCTWTVVSSSSTDMEVHGTSCKTSKGMDLEADITMKIHVVDSENVTATVQTTATGGGRTANISNSFTGKWISGACSASQ